MSRSTRVTLALTLAVALAACGGGGDGDDTSDSARLRFVLFGDAVEVAGYEDLVATYEDKNPGVDVTLSPVPTQDELLARLTTSFAGGRPPDVFLVNYRSYGQFAAADVLEPVQTYVERSDVVALDDFAPAPLDAFRFDGDELTCMPQNVSSLAVYYNVDLFEQAGLPAPTAGWTWDDFLAAAASITGDGRYGVGVEPSLIRLAPFVWSNGAEPVDDPRDPTRLALDSPRAREALDFFLDLRSRHGVVPPQREEQSQSSEARFLAGSLGMLLDSRKAVPTLRTIDGFEWDVAPLPVAPGGVPATILHGDAYCLSRDANPDAAWSFVEFANSREGQTILAKSGRTVPSRLDVARSPAFLEPDQAPRSAQVFLDAVPYVRAVPHTATWSQAEKRADDILAAMFYEQVDREAGLRRLLDETAPLLAREVP